MTNPYSVSIISIIMQLFFEADENTFIGYLVGVVAFLPDLYKEAKPENIESKYELYRQHYQLVDSYGKTAHVKNDQFYNFLYDDRFELTETGEYQFCYEFLHRHIKNKNRVVPRIVYDAIIKYLKMIPFIAQDFPEHAEKSVLSLLHMTKQFITLYSCEIFEVIKTLMHQIEIFRRWPFPVGVLASELVEILFQECKCKGTAFRMKLREELPDIDFFENPRSNQSFSMANQSFDQQQQNIPMFNQIPSEQSKVLDKQILPVFTFVEDRQSDATNVLLYAQNVLRANMNQLYSRLYTPHCLRAFVCGQVLALEKMNSDKLTHLAGLSEQDIFNLYCKLLVILEKCDELDSLLDIKLIQENAFDEIVKELLKLKVDQPTLQNDLAEIMQKNQLIIPEFPYYMLHGAGTKPFQIAHKQSIVRMDVQHNSPPNPSIQLVKEFIKQAYDMYLPLHTEPLRLLVVGGDQELGQICMLLGEIYQTDPFKIRTLDIRVFIVPSRDNSLAEFIASRDPWYQRYLYIPFMDDILIPRLDTIKEEISKGKEQQQFADKSQLEGQTPLEMKALCLNSYLREAVRAYNVRVFKLKMWQMPPSAGGVSINVQGSQYGLNPQTAPDGLIVSTVYFCCNMLLGAVAEFELIKERTKDEKSKGQSFYDFKEKNLCKFQYLNMKVLSESTDMLGNMTHDQSLVVQLHSGKINNVYTDFFEGNMPMPHTDWLELSYISFENSKLFDAGLKQKNLFKKHTKESIQNAFTSLFTNVSVTKILMEEMNRKPFAAVVDGRIFTDIIRFKINTTHMKKEQIQKVKSKLNNPTDISAIENLNLPIMSFLPFKV